LNNLHDKVRPGRPFTDISAQIVRLLNDEPFSSTRRLARQSAVTKGVVKRNLQEVLGLHKCRLKWVPNVLSAEQKATKVEISRELNNDLIFERQETFATIITGDENWYYYSYTESLMWARSRDDVSTRPPQKIDSKRSALTICFSGEKLAFLDSLPKGQNMDSYYFCNTVLEGVKAGALTRTRKAPLRDFHIHMDNHKVHNSKSMKGKLDVIRLIDGTIHHTHPIFHPRTFGFSGGVKKV
jgi:hypothetical protein